MANKRLEEIRRARIKKVKELEKLGIEAYPSKVKGNPQPICKLSENLGKTVEAAGRIVAWREHGNMIFADLKDASGKIQLWFQRNSLKENFDILKLLDVGDFLYVKGKTTKTKAGEMTIDVSDFQLLTKSIRPLPSSWHGLKDVEERYRMRYVDLAVNDEVRKVFETKAKVIKLLRKYLDEKGFMEVKTPALQPVYGGATAKPFITHHNTLDVDLYLRIADELYLKRLIVGGFEKVYEICTDFRNEGIDRWHNPEFTMLEFYWAYADYDDLMRMTEDMLSGIVKEIHGTFEIKYGKKVIDFKPPWKRLSFADAIMQYTGIDIQENGNLEDILKIIKKKEIKLDPKETKDLTLVMDALYKKKVRPGITNPTFIIDHPYYMRPLAKRHKEDERIVKSLQPVAAGAELLNAYSELNDPAEQKLRWEEDAGRAEKGAQEHQVVDEDFIKALEYGMPPTAGWGMGIDRFTAIVTNQHSIKDTILFPTMRPKK